MKDITVKSLLILVMVIYAPLCGAHDVSAEEVSPAGGFINPGSVAAISMPVGTLPMFSNWQVGQEATPIQFRFTARANTAYQIFIGFNEAWWDKAGQRVMDVELNGKIVATVDSFQGRMNVPSGHVLPVTSDSAGSIQLRVLPHPGAPDQNTVVCGLMLFDKDVVLKASDIINGRGPQPLVSVSAGQTTPLPNLENCFIGRKYVPSPVPTFVQTRDKLPQPIFDEEPAYVDCYWKTWELAFRSFRQPGPESTFPSNYIDEAFNEALFLWDTAFMTMFCRYGHPYVPGIQSLDNFYASQMPDGEIVREISEVDGSPRVNWAKPGTPHSLNHPILAWAELESYQISNDKRRLAEVYPPLCAYYRAYDKIKDVPSGFYLGSWASMDNSPRVEGMLCSIDTTCEVVLFARNLATMADILGRTNEAERWTRDADALTRMINETLWDPDTGFYYDSNGKRERHNVRTIAAYWALVAGVADQAKADSLAAHLTDPAKFHRVHRVPTVPADQTGYHPQGHYWRGGVWTPTDIMVIRGLERYGKTELARDIALNHLETVFQVWQRTGTVWEFYQPDAPEPGVQPGHQTRADFVGWTGNAPISLFIEYKLGIRVNAPANTVTWSITSPKRHGIAKLWFGGITADLLCSDLDSDGRRTVTVTADSDFTLVIDHQRSSRSYLIKAGQATILDL